MARIALGVALLPWAILFLPATAGAQEELSWSDFRPCERCELRAHRLVSLGEEGGPGVIESDVVIVVTAPGRGYIATGRDRGFAPQFSLFDEQGRFLRNIGREGDGPGELRGVAGARFEEPDQVVVLDLGRRWLTFKESGDLVSEVRDERLPPGRFLLTDDGERAVVGTLGRRPESAGFPLHMVDRRTGTPTDHFGTDDPNWYIGLPYGGGVNLGESGTVTNTVWWGKGGVPQVEEWTLEGELVRRISGPLEWFPVRLPPRPDPNLPPAVGMTGLAVDPEERLWVLTTVPNPGWRTVPRDGIEGSVRPGRAHELRDSRLDVFDLRTRRHLGHIRWDSPGAMLTTRGEQVVLYAVEYETPRWPRAVVYEIEVMDP